MEDMRQELFDKIATHLFTQGKPAMEQGQCCYRTSGGLKCAVGCLITDEEYTPALEGVGVQASDFDKFYWVNDYTRSLLRDLQQLHDCSFLEEYHYWATTETMKLALGRLARRHNLKSDVLDSLSFSDR